MSIRKNAVGQQKRVHAMLAGVRYLLWACLVAGCASGGPKPPAARTGPSPAAQPPELKTVTTPIGRAHAPTTEAMINQQLESMLKEIPIGAQVPRTAFADVTYPRSREEFTAMGGFTLLLVSSFARDGRELPLERVVANSGTANADLPLVARQETRLPTGTVADMLGSRRVDEVYLLPAFATAVDTTITVHFQLSGRALDVLRFPAPAERGPLPESVDLDAELREPGMDALEQLIQRELPVIRPGAVVPDAPGPK